MPAARVFEHRQVWRVTPELFDTAIALLTDAVLGEHGLVDHVVGIAEGGNEPARALASILDARAYSVRAQHNVDAAVYQQATGNVRLDLEPLTRVLGGHRLAGRVLLVDDICGSGATLHHVRFGLTPHLGSNANLVTATVCLNAGATTLPDYSVWTVSDWVIFPWEHLSPDRETTALTIPAEVTRHV